MTIQFIRYVLILVCLLFHTAVAQESPAFVSGEVVKIADGDTLTLLTPEKEQVKVRLAEIDTPEKGQPYYQKAKQALADRVFRQNIQVEIVDWDRYGRAVGKIILDGENVNTWMVAEGHAWVYRKYSDSRALLELEEAARNSAKGIWALPESERIPPWEWRSGNRAGPDQDSGAAKAYTCGSKTYCREMTSCEEAKFYLRQCNLTRLDGDDDGLPCESLCR